MAETVEELLAAAEAVALRGGEVLRERWTAPRTVDFKGGIDLVTDADRASEAAILELLRRRWPDHDVVAEESAAQLRGGPCRWYVDPLDGTSNYAHGVPHFCVSAGVTDASGLAAGAVYQPLTGELFTAGRGLGAFSNGRPIHAGGRQALAACLVATGFPYDVWDHPERPLRMLGAAVTRARGVRRFGSAALDLAYVACGRFDGYFELGLKPWDVAAGILLVREAGGLATDLGGGPLRLDGGEILAASRGVHAELSALLRDL